MNNYILFKFLFAAIETSPGFKSKFLAILFTSGENYLCIRSLYVF